jgi:FlaG/FlaF family flagellin (archaellin)
VRFYDEIGKSCAVAVALLIAVAVILGFLLIVWLR